MDLIPDSAPSYWFGDKRPNQLSPSRTQLDLVNSGVTIPLINGSRSKFEDS